ncbi:MAG: type II toxin-antitoxin system HicB family antitoxin [Planctomycetota bacterium]
MRQVVLYQDEDGVWIAEVPSLPGCHSAGETRDEAMDNVFDAITVWVEHARAHQLTVPAEPGTAEIRQIESDAA